jgi:hypothetical protein
MEVILALLFLAAVFAIPVGMVVAGVVMLRSIFRSRRTVQPTAVQATRFDSVHRAFVQPFSDGSAHLASALPDDLLLEHYRASLGKIAKHNGRDMEQFSTDLGEMLIIHMEIASRFAVYTDRKSRV